MIEETRVLSMLDLLSDRAREFIQVSDEVLEGEHSLQARDTKKPDEWQVCSVISAFINYVAESERCRYGHFAFDLEKRNNENKQQDAINTLHRMKMFWQHEDDVDLDEQQLEIRRAHIEKFLANDLEIKTHLAQQPSMFELETTPNGHVISNASREWMINLRSLGEKEAALLREWNDVVSATTPKKV